MPYRARECVDACRAVQNVRHPSLHQSDMSTLGVRSERRARSNTSPHPFLRFSSISSSLPALPAASSTTRNTTGTKPYVAAASTTNSVATTGITDGGKTPSTSGSRRTTSGTGASSAAAAVGTRTPSSVRRTRARWSRAVRTGVDADAEVGGGCKLIATVAECWCGG